MPEDPDYDLQVTRAGVQGYSYIHGVEYEAPAPNNAHHDLNVPCAVCLARGRNSELMIPGKLYCPKKWTLEYTGFLMSDHISYYRNMFECVDKDLEYVPGNENNQNGGLVYTWK